jgi:tripartite-type tricarboxylate transporter receptor subunit TctC
VVTVVSYVPNVIVIHPKHETIRTYRDFLAYVKAHPGKLNFGSAGNGTVAPPRGRAASRCAPAPNIVHVPYKGAGPMMQDLIAGNVDLAFDGMGSSAAQIKAGSCARSRFPPLRARLSFPTSPR